LGAVVDFSGGLREAQSVVAQSVLMAAGAEALGESTSPPLELVEPQAAIVRRAMPPRARSRRVMV